MFHPENTIFSSSTSNNFLFALTRTTEQQTAITTGFWGILFGFLQRSFVHVTERWEQKRATTQEPTWLSLPSYSSANPVKFLTAQPLPGYFQWNPTRTMGSLFYSKSKCFAASNVNILINGVFFNSLLPYSRSHSQKLSAQQHRSTAVIERNREIPHRKKTSEKPPF